MVGVVAALSVSVVVECSLVKDVTAGAGGRNANVPPRREKMHHRDSDVFIIFFIMFDFKKNRILRCYPTIIIILAPRGRVLVSKNKNAFVRYGSLSLYGTL